MKIVCIFQQQLDEWRLEMKTKFEEFENNLIRDENLRGHVDVLIKDNRISATKIQNLESDLVNLKLRISKNAINMSPSDEFLPQELFTIHQILENQQEQIS